MNSSKTDIKELGENMIEAVENGEKYALDEIVRVTKEIEFLKSYKEKLKKIAIDELYDKYGGKKTYLHGAYVEISYSGDRLDYSQDSVWNEYHSLEKQRENVLKTAFKSEFTMVDDNGEVVPKVGIKTHGKQIIKISY